MHRTHINRRTLNLWWTKPYLILYKLVQRKTRDNYVDTLYKCRKSLVQGALDLKKMTSVQQGQQVQQGMRELHTPVGYVLLHIRGFHASANLPRSPILALHETARCKPTPCSAFYVHYCTDTIAWTTLKCVSNVRIALVMIISAIPVESVHHEIGKPHGHVVVEIFTDQFDILLRVAASHVHRQYTRYRCHRVRDWTHGFVEGVAHHICTTAKVVQNVQAINNFTRHSFLNQTVLQLYKGLQKNTDNDQVCLSKANFLISE